MLLRTIEQKAPLDTRSRELCTQYFQPLTCARYTVLEEQGRVPAHLYFINAGYTRLCYPDEQGSTVTTYIGTPATFFTSFLPFVQQQPAGESAVCDTDCELLRIARPDLQALITASEPFKQFSLLIFEQALGAAAVRANDLATLSAEQRYRKLLTQHPDILRHVAVQHLASYLGIKPESLSRIRRQRS